MSETPEQCDVAIIGGGPAGSLAAAFLARAGYEAVLIEKDRHPRYHVGESLIPHLWKFLALAGADDLIERENFMVKAGGTVIWNGSIRQVSFKDFGFTRAALHVERDRFDHLLLQHASASGATVLEDTLVTDAQPGEDGSWVDYRPKGDAKSVRLRARTIIDASGQGAVLARKLGLREVDQDFRFMSAWGYFQDARFVALDGKSHAFSERHEIPPTTFVTSVDEVGPWSWLWHIPLRETTSIGLILPNDYFRRDNDGSRKTHPEQEFESLCRRIPHLDELLADATLEPDNFHIIRDYSYKTSCVSGPGFYLAGDAGGFVDPIFSQGLLVAAYSAWLSTWAIDQGFKKPAHSERYRAIFEKEMVSRTEVMRSLALPRYLTDEERQDAALDSVELASKEERNLMATVAGLTNRSDNFSRLSGENQSHVAKSETRFRTLEAIETV